MFLSVITSLFQRCVAATNIIQKDKDPPSSPKTAADQQSIAAVTPLIYTGSKLRHGGEGRQRKHAQHRGGFRLRIKTRVGGFILRSAEVRRRPTTPHALL